MAAKACFVRTSHDFMGCCIHVLSTLLVALSSAAQARKRSSLVTCCVVGSSYWLFHATWETYQVTATWEVLHALWCHKGRIWDIARVVASFPGSYAPEWEYVYVGRAWYLYPKEWNRKKAKVARNLLHIPSYWGVNIIHTEHWMHSWLNVLKLRFCCKNCGPFLITLFFTLECPHAINPFLLLTVLM